MIYNSKILKNLRANLSKIKDSNEVNKIAKNFGWLFFDKIFKSAVGIFVSAWIARYLGPEQYGIWNYVIAFISIFAVIAGLGIDEIIARDLVKNPKERNGILGTAYIMKMMIGILSLILCILLGIIFNPEDDFTVLLIAITSISLLVYPVNVINSYFKSLTRSKYTVLSRNISFGLFTAIRIGLLFTKSPLIYFVIASTLELCVYAGVMIYFYKVHFRLNLNWKWDKSIFYQLLQDGWPLTLSSIAVVLYMKIDQIMLMELAGAAEVGIYSITVKLTEIWYFIPMIISSSVFPSLVMAKNGSEGKYYQRLSKFYSVMMLLGLFLSVTIFFGSDLIVSILFGSAYEKSADILKIFVWNTVLVFMGVATTQFITIENIPKIALYRTGIGLTLNVILNILLIPKYLGFGAAIASLISYFFASLVGFAFKGMRSQLILILSILNPLRYFYEHKE